VLFIYALRELLTRDMLQSMLQPSLCNCAQQLLLEDHLQKPHTWKVSDQAARHFRQTSQKLAANYRKNEKEFMEDLPEN